MLSGSLASVAAGQPSLDPWRIVLRYSFVMLVLSLAPQGVHAADPVKLVVGYQPYDTISYSAVVIRGLELWKKYLPPGSTVEFESALQGAIIVNAMLADKQQIGYLG